MTRKNSKKTRYDGMNQRQQQRVDHSYTRRNDAVDWTNKLFEKLKETDRNPNEQNI